MDEAGPKEMMLLSKGTRPEAYLQAKRIEFRYNRNELQFPCPWCGQDTFSMNSQTGLFRCWRANHCGVTGGLHKLAKHLGDSISNDGGTVLQFDADTAERDRVARTEAQREAAEEKVESYDVESAHQRFVDAGWIDWTGAEWDWHPDVIKELKIGVDQQWFPELGREEVCMVFPYVAYGGSLHNVQFRTLPGKEKAMRWLAGGLGTIPFNAEGDWLDAPTVVLVEGAKDAVTLQSILRAAGDDWMDHSAVGIPGAGSHPAEWLELLSKPDKLVVMFDNDTAGREGAAKFRAAYSTLATRFYQAVLPNAGVKDVTEYVGQGCDHLALLDRLKKAF